MWKWKRHFQSATPFASDLDLVDSFRQLGITRAILAYNEANIFADGCHEPRNAGPWYFMNANLANIIGTRLPLSVVSRPPAASPATGSKASHDLEQQRLLAEAFAG